MRYSALLLALGVATVAAAAPPKSPKNTPSSAPKAPPRSAPPKPALPASVVPAASRSNPADLPGMLQPQMPEALAEALPVLPRTQPVLLFQTSSEYDPRLDLKADLVAVHRHGESRESVEQAIRSWNARGYPVHRMFFIGSDARNVYTSGGFDGKPHLDEIETDALGNPLKIGDRPYMIPTAGWLGYLKEQIRQAIDAGAVGIWPEEPLLHAAGGYSPAFKNAWQQLYGSPWQPPHENPTNYFRASRLKADLYLLAVDELLRFTKAYAREKNRDVKFYLPVHSPVSYAASKLIFPHLTATRLPIDGVVAQVWSGPARTPVTYEGRTETRFFESSWLMYSSFASLMEGFKNRPLYFLADPVEDNPNYSWPEYERWYKSVLAASLLFPQARGYEVMPWPERIFLPGSIAKGTPAPQSYRTTLANLMTVLKDLPNGDLMRWNGGTQGIGVLTLDTLMWQRGGPQGSSMNSLYGLTLPLLKRGVPVEVVPAERVADPAFLARFKVLLLSYDMQKPLGPEINEGLAQWVRNGGQLLVFGGEDAYNEIGEWWTRSGYAGPTEHLFRQCDLPVDLLQRQVHGGPTRYREALKADRRLRDGENRQVYTIPLAPFFGAEGSAEKRQPVLVRFADLFPDDGWGPTVARVRVREGSRVRADFQPGTAGERPFLFNAGTSQTNASGRFADGDAAFVYRFTELGPEATLELDLSNQFHVSVAVGAASGMSLQPTQEHWPAFSVAGTQAVVTYSLNGATALYEARLGNDRVHPAWWARSGKGTVIYCGLPAAFGAETRPGADLIRSLTAFACDRARLRYTEGPLLARRGDYVIAHAMERHLRLKGQYLDLYHPDLPLVEDPELPYREPGLYKQVQLLTRIPTLLHASHQATVLEGNAARLRLQLEGPSDTRGVLRVFMAGMSVAGIEAQDATGRRMDVDVAVEGRTLRVRYPQIPTGITLTIRWVRPEARLTK